MISKEDLHTTNDTLRVLGEIGDAQTAEELSQLLLDGKWLPKTVKAAIPDAVDKIQTREKKPGA